jgi:hypothetical protein
MYSLNYAIWVSKTHETSSKSLKLTPRVFKTSANSVMLGTGFENLYSRWTTATALDTVDLSKIHGHISALSEDTFGESNQEG